MLNYVFYRSLNRKISTCSIQGGTGVDYSPTSFFAGLVRLLIFGFCWLMYLSNAYCQVQACQGVLGNAIVNQTFGEGKRGSLQSGQSSYTYVAGSCPNDGEYTLADSVNGSCFGSVWHSVKVDHTPDDTNGNMLLINATYGSGAIFYVQSLSGLCSGINYEFSVWILNLYNPNSTKGCGSLVPRDPDITLRVETPDGKLIQTLNTGVIARFNTPTWVQCSMVYKVPPNVGVVLIKLANNGLGGCGNDLAMDDIQVRPCTPILHINFTGDSTSSRVLCDGQQLGLNSSISSEYSLPSYQWQESIDNSTWQDINSATGRMYSVNTGSGKRFYRLQCRPASLSGGGECTPYQLLSNVLTVESVLRSVRSLPADTLLCQNSQVRLSMPQVKPDDIHYTWFDGSSDQVKTISQPGIYWLESDNRGCVYRDSIKIMMEDCGFPQIHIPTAFSPNNDGINDLLDVFGEQIEKFDLTIYDRWGNVVFVSNSPSHRWNGEYKNQPCLTGTYSWIINYNVTHRGNQLANIEKAGQVLLVR